MSNLLAGTQLNGMGAEGQRFHVAVDGGTALWEGAHVSQLYATGRLVPTGTAGSGPCIGKATHDVASPANDNVARCLIETERMYHAANGESGDAFAETDPIGLPVFALDDNLISKVSTGGRQQVGIFYGMEASGRIRYFISPRIAAESYKIQSGTGTLVAGVLTLNAGITVTAVSRVIVTLKTPAGTFSDGGFDAPSADRVVGGPGTGTVVIRALVQAGTANVADTSTVDWVIVG